MEQSFVEAAASSLVREFLSRKGLKKTSAALEVEFPRSSQSINNRNELRSVLHLESLYKENKLADRPLKTLLELITKYFLESFGKNQMLKMTGDRNTEATKIFIRGNQRKEPEASPLDVYDLSDEDAGESSAVSDSSVTHRSRNDKPSCYHKDRPKATREDYPKSENSTESSRTYKDEANLTREVKRETSRVAEGPAEGPRPKSSRIVRGMMSGPIASVQEEPLKKRGQRRSSASYQTVLAKDDPLINGRVGTTSSPPNPALQLGKEFSAKLLIASSTNSVPRNPSVTSVTKQQPHSSAGEGTESAADAYRDFKMRLSAGAEQEKRQKPSKSEGVDGSRRKSYTSITREDGEDDLRLDDVEEDLLSDDSAKIPSLLTRSKSQVEGKPIDLQQATELKKLLFGSALRCFSEEWKVQSFTFSNTKNLKYGIVQKKGGPCGVLAAVQACVLKHLLFGKQSDVSRPLQPSDALRTSCLYKALADVLWRAGDGKEAVVTLSSGRQQFSPAGRYKADGILESLILYRFRKSEDLVTFLQQNINQFERGPFGCILFTVSVVFSRAVELVQKDFDVPTNCLIGAHAYCTQELVNLILGGRAVSNVFNDVMELDSGDGHVTLLRGIPCRSDIGLLSLFEHYNVCQVGSYLKTPKYPIWVVCSESHFSVLFCLKKELTSDWKAERRFDLFCYDGLANQQEEIRLTVDTSGTYIEDKDNDLIPPLEYCIRTKWRGAVVDWNGTDPIL
ncbi:probable ubiquitin carboxyl-terminal hydrolase MINDY-4 [Bufo bufo]|uniref:probable ubiquitin carboxyl-terminal hydrolase MINDY-4 n=1 Tax=Bufo bufo TaxID=8384 RepID=UPI001ABE5308|nr:probable ubiquitin carboxyl-terminal hydrolase MINDY-4 [Bufo bufo]